jgi:hypothetical protein
VVVGPGGKWAGSDQGKGLASFLLPLFFPGNSFFFSCSILLGNKRERFEGDFKTVQIPQIS